MEKFSELYEEFKVYILCFILLIIIITISGLLFYHFQTNINYLKKELKEKQVIKEEIKEKENDTLIVDVKGEVKRPGVYYLDKDKRVIDAINKAGGFTKSANTFANNLSMKLKDEMVIIIYSKDEINKYLETKEKENNIIEKCQNDKITNNSCISNVNGENNFSTNTNITSKTITKSNTSSSNNKTTNSTDTKDTKISLNTATKEELMTISGIGESKAIAIIEYRQTKPFETIEEIKEVSGIGDSLYEKIKDYITT